MSTPSFTRRRTLVVAVTVASALILTGCGSSSSSHHNVTAVSSASYGPPASGPHNATDVAFAVDMIPHHAQAVEMATMALQQATNVQVKALATAIQGAQDPEILMMSGWLAGWGEKVPSASSHAMSGTSTNGMMSAAEMQQLSQASGAAFDRLWVQMMTRHHQGAVAMANTELTAGQSGEAKALATKIITAQTSEIAAMAALAKTLPQ